MSKNSPAPVETVDLLTEAQHQWLAHWGEGPTPSMAAVTSIMRAQQILLGRLNAILKPFGLTFPRYEALMILYLSRRGELPLGKIGDRLQVHPTSVTSIIDGLERTGHLRRLPHPTDRRATLAQITDAGRSTAEAATDALNAQRFCTAPFGAEELESIVELLRPLRADADGFD